MLSLRGTKPLIAEALAVSPAALLVYIFMWDSAEIHYDDENGNSGTTKWSHKGIAKELRLGKTTVLKAIDGLLDAGLIQRNGYVPTGKGSPKLSYRVTHPGMLDAQRYAISVMGLPSQREEARPTKPNYDNNDDSLELPEAPPPGNAESWQRAIDKIRDACAADGSNPGEPEIPQHILDGYRGRPAAVRAAQGLGEQEEGSRRQVRPEPFGWNKAIPKKEREALRAANAERVARYREERGLDAQIS